MAGTGKSLLRNYLINKPTCCLLLFCCCCLSWLDKTTTSEHGSNSHGCLEHSSDCQPSSDTLHNAVRIFYSIKFNFISKGFTLKQFYYIRNLVADKNKNIHTVKCMCVFNPPPFKSQDSYTYKSTRTMKATNEWHVSSGDEGGDEWKKNVMLAATEVKHAIIIWKSLTLSKSCILQP